VVQEAEAVELYFIAGRGDEVIDVERRLGSVSGKFQANAVAVGGHFFHGGGEVHGDLAVYLFFCEPTWRRPEMTLYGTDAEMRGHCVEDKRYVRAEARTPAETETRARVQESLGTRAWLNGRFVEGDCASSSDEFHVGAFIMKQACNVDGGCTGSEDSDGAIAKAAQVLVFRAMRDLFMRQPREHGRHIGKVCDAGGHDDFSGFYDSAFFREKIVTVGRTRYEDDVCLLQVWDEAFLKLQTVSHEGFNGYWKSDELIWEFPFRTEVR
jgi:hypothetical protein